MIRTLVAGVTLAALGALLLMPRPPEPPRSSGRVLARAGKLVVTEREAVELASQRSRPRAFGGEEMARAVSLAKPRAPSEEEVKAALELLIDDAAMAEAALATGHAGDPLLRRRLVARVLEEALAPSDHHGCGCETERPSVEDPRAAAFVAKARSEAGTWIARDAIDLAGALATSSGSPASRAAPGASRTGSR